MRIALSLGHPKDGLPEHTAGLVQSMLAPPVPDLPAPSADTVRAFPGGALAWVPRSGEQAAIPRVYEGRDGSFLVVSGVPILLGEPVEAKLRQAALAGASAVKGLAKELDGIFALFFHDAGARTFSIHTDRLGFEPLYWHRREGLLLVASSAAAVARSGLVPLTLNPAAWGAFLRYGTTLGNSTYCNDIERLPSDAAISWDEATGRLYVEEHYWWPAADPSLTLESFDTGAAVDILKAEIRAFRQWYPQPSLLLSGGGDSRLLLALLEDAGCPHAVTINHPDEMFDLDGRLAAALAKNRVGRFERLGTHRDYYSSLDYFDFLQLHEVAAPSAELFIANLFGPLRRRPLPGFWSGAMPGIHLFPPAESGTLTSFLERAVLPVDHRRVAQPLSLFRDRDGILSGFAGQLEQIAGRLPDEASSIAPFAVPNRYRNRLAAIPLKVLGPYSQALTPGVSREIFSRVLALPLHCRQNHQLWDLLFERHFPAYLKQPLVSRGKVKLTRHTSLGWKLFTTAAASYRGSIPHRIVTKIAGSANEYFRPSALVDQIILRIDPGHEDLNADAVRKLQEAGPGDRRDWYLQYTRQILFHWKVWRDLMEGKSPAVREELFAAGDVVRNP